MILQLIAEAVDAGARRSRACQELGYHISAQLCVGAVLSLYLVVDVWSRKIVGFCVEEFECMEVSSRLITSISERLGIKPGTLVLHADNGSPMKGSTMLATLENLGVAASFSRPSVSNDNPFSESLFGTMKSRPSYPHNPFRSMAEARMWVEAFVNWYNQVYLHSAIGFVAPEDRHTGRDTDILNNRDSLFKNPRKRHPERWNGSTHDWSRNEVVKLNPGKNTKTKNIRKEVAA